MNTKYSNPIYAAFCEEKDWKSKHGGADFRLNFDYTTNLIS